MNINTFMFVTKITTRGKQPLIKKLIITERLHVHLLSAKQGKERLLGGVMYKFTSRPNRNDGGGQPSLFPHYR
jgi:hypothetical protein